MAAGALSGAATFAACLALFRRYPLAVTPRHADGGHRSIVLMNRAAGPAGYFVLTQARDDLFVIRSWDRRGGVGEGIRPRERVSGAMHEVITGGVPVPHDGALLGWVADSQVTTLLAVHCRQPEGWEYPVPLPEIRVMPMAGTGELEWPPFAASPVGDGRLWEHVEWGEIVDIVPLCTQRAGRAFWVPSPDTRSPGHGCVVITDHARGDAYWLPAGVYMDHWMLREGIQAPPAHCLLALPGVVDLAYSTPRPGPDRPAVSGSVPVHHRSFGKEIQLYRTGSGVTVRIWRVRRRWRNAGVVRSGHDDTHPPGPAAAGSERLMPR